MGKYTIQKRKNDMLAKHIEALNEIIDDYKYEIRIYNEFMNAHPDVKEEYDKWYNDHLFHLLEAGDAQTVNNIKNVLNDTGKKVLDSIVGGKEDENHNLQ